MPGGADSQLGFVSETTPGTAVTVTKFMPIQSENIKHAINYLDTQTLSSRRTLRVTRPGQHMVSGPIKTELGNTTAATLLRHMFGTIATTGAGPYVHTASPGSLTGQSLTIQVGRPFSTGTVQPFTYAGCKIASWTISSALNQLVQLDLNIVGMTEVTATALATASYDSTWSPFSYLDASFTVAAGAENTATGFTLTGDNKIVERPHLGSATTSNPLEVGVRSYTGTITTDFDSLTDYTRFTAGTQAALVVTFNNGTQTLVITANVQFTGDTPQVAGPSLLNQVLPFRVLSGTSDAAAITAVLTNSESAST